MDKQNFYLQCQCFEEKISAYVGEDPMQSYYEFVEWLEGNHARFGAFDTYAQVLEQTILTFKADQRYKQDQRFIQIILFHINMVANKLQSFECLIEEGIGTSCSILFVAWAKELIKLSQFSNAESVLLKGKEFNAEPLPLLEETHQNLLIEVGRLVLAKELDCKTTGIHCRCHTSTTVETSKSAPQPSVFNWEFNPLKPGEPDTFTVPLVHLEPEDPSKVPVYPKNLVYVRNTEIQMEEVRALIYLKKYEDDLKRLDEPSSKGASPVKTQPSSPISLNNQSFQPGCVDASQSITMHTKVALNLVQEMWSSPSPAVNVRYSSKKADDSLFKVPEPPKQPSEGGPSTPFTIFEDSSNFDNLKNDQGSKGRPSSSKVGISERKLPLQPNSDRGSAKQLLFDNGPPVASCSSASDDVLAEQLEPKPPLSLPVFPNVQETPCEWNDSDVTCNTNVFSKFLFNASTPNMKSKTDQPSTSSAKTAPLVEVPTFHGQTKGNLSIILEASKEKGSMTSSQASALGNDMSSEKSPVLSEIGVNFSCLKLDSSVDPFSMEVRQTILSKMNFPNNLNLIKLGGGHFAKNVLAPCLEKQMKLGNETYSIMDEPTVSEGIQIVKAKCRDRLVTLKFLDTVSYWEYYISKEILSRVDANFVAYFMDIRNAYVFKNGCIFETDWSEFGSLLTAVNKYKANTGISLVINIAAYFCIQVFKIVSLLHSKCQIIHGDIKPDNFLIRSLPCLNSVQIQLTNFSNSIDMSVFPKGCKFTQVVNNSEGCLCNEMRENKPWTYQIDLYGLAGTIYFLLVGNPMKVLKKKNVWTLQKNLPRELKKDIWDPIFIRLLNVESCEILPNLDGMAETLEKFYQTLDSVYSEKLFQDFGEILRK